MNAAYALYLVIRCQLLPGVLLSRHLDRGLIQRFNFQRDCAIHKTATIWGLMFKYFLSFKSIFCQAKIQAENDAEIQAKMDAKIQAENNAEIQAKKKANIHNLYLSKHYAMYHKT